MLIKLVNIPQILFLTFLDDLIGLLFSLGKMDFFLDFAVLDFLL